MKLPQPSRRRFLQTPALAGAAAALAGTATARSRQGSSAPEVGELRIGIVAVQSCASIVAAHEKGFFKKHGVTTTLAKENGWAAARDKLVSGENLASHLKYGQPVGCTVGVSGSPKTAMVAPYTLARNGSVFMVARKFAGKLTFDPKSWRTALDERKAAGETLTIALPLPYGFHGMMYRHFLANGGVNADKELKFIALPPAQMVQNMRVGTMEACSLVEPWGARGVGDKVSAIAMYGHEMWKDHPVKSFAFMEGWAEANPRTVRALLRGLHEGALWCDDPKNRPELAKMLSTPTYLNVAESYILPPLEGRFDWGDGRAKTMPEAAISYSRATHPDERQAAWFMANFRRWGMVEGPQDHAAVARKVCSARFHEEAMRELGLPAEPQPEGEIRLWDGTSFDAAKAEDYAKSFAIHGLKG